MRRQHQPDKLRTIDKYFHILAKMKVLQLGSFHSLSHYRVGSYEEMKTDHLEIDFFVDNVRFEQRIYWWQMEGVQ